MSLSLKPATQSWGDRTISIGMILALLLVLATGVFAFLAMTGSFNASDASQDVKDAQSITSCRSALYSDVVGASTDLQLVQARLQSLNTRGLQASARGQSLEQVLDQADLVVGESEAKAAALDAATVQYKAAAALAGVDPAAFLEQCKPHLKENDS